MPELTMDELLADIQLRLTHLPIEVGEGKTIAALPAPETVDWSVPMYRSNREFLDYVKAAARWR